MSTTMIDVSGDLTTPYENGAKQWLRPFPDVTARFVFRQQYYQLLTDHAPLTLDSPHPDLSGFYLVAESEVSPVNNGSVVDWTREWSQIPPPRVVPESFAWYRPAFGSGESPGSAVAVTSASNSAGATLLTLASVSGLSVDDLLIVSYTVTIPGTGSVGRQSRSAITAINGTTVTVGLISDNNPITFQTAQRAAPTRDATTVTVASEVEFDYFLPGVSTGINAISDITLISPFEGLGADGGFTNTLTETTEPTAAEFLRKIGTNERIVIEGSVIRRWKGNIFERATRYAPAA